MNKPAATYKPRNNGKYTLRKMDRVCKRCGKTLGEHTAAAPHTCPDDQGDFQK